MKKLAAMALTLSFALFGFVPLIATPAQASSFTLTVVESGGSPEGTGWSYGSGQITVSNTVSINASDISSKLANGDLAVLADVIRVNASISTVTSHNFELKATGSIRIAGPAATAASISTNGGSVMLVADSDGNETGEIRLGTLGTSGGVISTSGGDISLVGGSNPSSGFAWASSDTETNKPAAGVALFGYDLNAGGGDITIRGKSKQNLSTRSVYFDYGAASDFPLVSTSGNGSVTVEGDASGAVSGTNPWGINFAGLSIVTDAGDINLTGKSENASSSNRRGIAGGPLSITSQTGNIQLIDTTDGSLASYSGLFANGYTISSSGTVTVKADEFQPAAGQRVEAASFTLDSYTGDSFTATTNLGALTLTGTPLSTIGKTNNSANLVVNGVVTTDGNLFLNSSGNITQSAKIEASGLGFGSTGSVDLTNQANDVDEIAGGTAGSPLGNFSFVDKDDLAVGTVGSLIGLYSSGVVNIETISGDLSVTQLLSSTATSTDSIRLYADNDAVAGSPGDGDLKLIGSGSITLDATSRALLYSGTDSTSTGLTSLVGGNSFTRSLVDAGTSLGSISPLLASTGRFALYRTETTTAPDTTTAPAPAPYSGPIPSTFSETCLPADGGTLTLFGKRLTGIFGATVDGKAASVSEVSATSLKVTFPALALGTYDVIYQSINGSITHLNSLRVCESSGSLDKEDSPELESGTEVGSPVASERIYVFKRFSNYRGDIGNVAEADRRAITAFIRANPGLTHVTCVGSTSGVPALETDAALARARATNACDIVESLIPGVEIRIATNTGLGVGQFFRAVTLFGKGTTEE